MKLTGTLWLVDVDCKDGRLVYICLIHQKTRRGRRGGQGAIELSVFHPSRHHLVDFEADVMLLLLLLLLQARSRGVTALGGGVLKNCEFEIIILAFVALVYTIVRYLP